MLDEHDRDLLRFPELPDLVDHAPALFGAHAGGRLVEQQHFWIEHQRQRDIEQFLVAMRQRRRGTVALAGKAEQFHGVLGAVAGLGKRKAPVQHAGAALVGAHRGQHRFLHRQRGKDARNLKRAADAVTHDIGRRPSGHVDAVEQDIWPESGFSAPVIRLKNVLLPAPLGPMTAVSEPSAKLERDIVGRLDAAKGFRECADLQHG